MKISADLNYLRMSPRKVRLVADAIRGKNVPAAERALKFIPRHAAGPLVKLLKSAVANARNNFQLNAPENLVVAEIAVNEGPTLKRRRARAMGRAFPIRKRTCHIHLVLEASGVLPAKKAKQKASISIVKEGATHETEREGTKPTLEREVYRDKAKVATKSTDFVKRMFRRKAI